MTHRDHISLGLIVYSGIVLASQHMSFPGMTGLVGVYAPVGFAAYLGGVSFPDTDLHIWPQLRSGHRVRSPLHRLDYPIVATIILWCLASFLYTAVYRYTFLDFFVQHFGWKLYLAAALPAAFTLGWFVHLLGDVIQGGVRLGFGSGKRVGFTSFKWDKYTTGWGVTFSMALKMVGLAVFGYFIKTHGLDIYGAETYVWIVLFLAVQAISFTSALKLESALVIYALAAIVFKYSGVLNGFSITRHLPWPIRRIF